MTIAIQPKLNYQRGDERICCVYPVYVHAICANGKHLKLNAIAKNIGERGLYMYLPCLLPKDTGIFTCICLPNRVHLAAMGRVVRIENQKNELIGAAVCFSRTRLLPISS
jgi:hypothetical protein